MSKSGSQDSLRDSQEYYSTGGFHREGKEKRIVDTSSDSDDADSSSQENPLSIGSGMLLRKAIAAARVKARTKKMSTADKLMADAMKDCSGTGAENLKTIPVFPEAETAKSKEVSPQKPPPKKKGGRIKVCVRKNDEPMRIPRQTRAQKAKLDAAVDNVGAAPQKKRKAHTPKAAGGTKRAKKVSRPITIDTEDDRSDAANYSSKVSGKSQSPIREQRRSGYIPLFRNDYYERFWSVNRGKNIIGECPVKKEELIDCGLWELVEFAGLEQTVLPIRRYVPDLVFEFYTNLSKDMFDDQSASYHKAFVRGSTFIFSPAVVDEFLGRTVGLVEDVEVDFDLVASKLTGGKFSQWHPRGKFSCSELSMKYVILHKIVLKNWYPSGHKTTVGKVMALVLFKIGEKRPINFGKLVLEMLEEHAEKKPCKKPIVFPGLITSIIAEKLDVITSEDVYCDIPKKILFNSKLFDEAVHFNDLPKAVGGKRKKLPVHLVSDSDAVSAKMAQMSSRVLVHLKRQYNRLTRVIMESTAERTEIEALLRAFQGGQLTLDTEEGPSGAKDDDGNEVVADSEDEDVDEELEVEHADDVAANPKA